MAKRPNILLMVSEDNGQHLGCYGDRNNHTPRLDELAQGGERFEENLARLTQEHDHIFNTYYKGNAWGHSRDYEWHYTDYLYEK